MLGDVEGHVVSGEFEGPENDGHMVGLDDVGLNDGSVTVGTNVGWAVGKDKLGLTEGGSVDGVLLGLSDGNDVGSFVNVVGAKDGSDVNGD